MLWSPVPPPLLTDAAVAPPARSDGESAEGRLPADGVGEENDAADAADMDSTMADTFSCKRSCSPSSSCGVKRQRWRSPAVSSSAGLGESQPSLPSPAVASAASPTAERAATNAETAMWKLTYSLFVALFDVALHGPLIAPKQSEG